MQPGVAPVPEEGGEAPALLGEVQRALENFEKVPVVNFGWVALFILVYILIVGPLDYFLLKRVFKRLELTWITFPVIVLIVSVAAYGTAYYLKGDDLRINKIDFVEYDLNAPQEAYGTSWFTLFSPRIQNYTVGLEPCGARLGRRRRRPTPSRTRSRWRPWPTPTCPSASARRAFPPALRLRRGRLRPGARADPRLVHALLSGVVARGPRSRQPAASPHPPPCPGRRQGPAQIGRRRSPTACRSICRASRCFTAACGTLFPTASPPGETFNVQSLFAPGKVGRADGLWVNDPQTLAPPAVGPNGVPTAAQ